MLRTWMILGFSCGLPLAAWSQGPPASASRSGLQVSTANWQSRHWSPAVDELLPPPPERSHVVLAGGELSGPPDLPNTHGQIWQEYDIRGYTERHPPEERPEQTIVDWILRETGTEMWFSDPLGVLTANRQTLRVYHTRDIQRIVGEMVDRFQSPRTSSHLFGVRLVTMSSPNWRAKAAPRLVPVSVQTPGVEAWLLSHEDATIVLGDLQKRTDFREHNSPNLLIRNGDVHEVSRTRPIAYVKGVQPFANGWSGQQMNMAQVEEGFSLRLSPLLAADGQHVDAVIKIDSQQVERFTSVSIPAPTAQNPREMATIKVPQTSSWRLHERFHWPADRVLLISCGVVASPAPEQANPLNLANLRLLPRPPRVDALLFVDAKGRSADFATSGSNPAQAGNLNYRGRY